MSEELYVSYLSGDPIVAYMAVQFAGISENNGWLPTSWGEETFSAFHPENPKNTTDALPIDGSGKTPANGPPNFKAWGPVTGIEWSIGREYTSGTFGGGRNAFRPQMSDVEIEREVDQISPYLMEYSATGKLLPNIHIIHQTKKLSKSTGSDGKETTGFVFETVSWIKLTNVLMSKYFYSTKAEKGEKGGPATITHYEKLEFNYSTITLQSNTTSKTCQKNQ